MPLYFVVCSHFVPEYRFLGGATGEGEEGMLATMATTQKRLSLTPELFGKLLVLVWAERFGRSILPSREELTQVLVGGSEADHVPQTVLDVMHLDQRLGAETIVEFTDYVLAAQEAGLVQRLNPSFVSGAVQIGSFDARKLLSVFEDDLKPEIEWIRSRLEKKYKNFAAAS
jgi:hypothetical protein